MVLLNFLIQLLDSYGKHVDKIKATTLIQMVWIFFKLKKNVSRWDTCHHLKNELRKKKKIKRKLLESFGNVRIWLK